MLKLERRSKVQNVGNSTAFLVVVLNFRLEFRLQADSDIKMAAIWKISKYFRKIQFENRYGKIVRNYPRKSIFNVDDATDDVTAWRQTWPSIFHV